MSQITRIIDHTLVDVRWYDTSTDDVT